MTLAAEPFGRRDRSGLRRWGGSLFIILALHVAAGLYLLSRQVPLSVSGPPPAAVTVDLAPLPAPAPPRPAPPEPVTEPQPLPRVKPHPPPEPVVPLPEVEPSPAPKPAVVLPKPPPKVKPRPKPIEPPPEPLPALPPPAAPAVVAPPAPAAPAPAANSAAGRVSWQAQLVGWLARYKRYPRLAREQRQEGTVYLRFTMARDGRVISSQIEKGSGYSLLDEEVNELIKRAQPLPALPPEVPGSQITLTLPVQFSLRSSLN
jgi:periplasmic protein TonB